MIDEMGWQIYLQRFIKSCAIQFAQQHCKIFKWAKLQTQYHPLLSMTDIVIINVQKLFTNFEAPVSGWYNILSPVLDRFKIFSNHANHIRKYMVIFI